MFGTDDTATTQTNLMVFLRPTILRDGKTRQVTAGRYDQTRDEQVRRNSEGVNLMPDEQEPVLPALEGLMNQLTPITGTDESAQDR